MKSALTYLFLLFTTCVSAQAITDTVRTYTLRTAVIEHTGKKWARPQNTLASKNLTEALRENTSIFLKSYGNGQLTSLSYRGTGAAQNDLLWNGIKLNNPSLGQVDVSLFNFGMADEMQLTPNSEAGNVGASINLISQNTIDSAVTLNGTISYGSFHTLNTFAQAKAGNGKVMGTTRVSYFRTENNFPFVNLYKAGAPTEKQSNAHVSVLHFMQQFALKVNRHNRLFFNLWLSDARRLIPPVMSKAYSLESQDDYSARTMLSWQGQIKAFQVNFTSAYLYDVLRYRNPEIYLDDKSIMQAFRNSFTFSTQALKKLWIAADAGYEYEQANVPAYTIIRHRHIGKLAATLTYAPVKELTLQVKLREHIYDKTFSPFSPFISVRYGKKLAKHTVQLHLNASRNFRFPTLNDLYWKPGGNPNLKTEKSWDGEIQAGYTFHHRGYVTVKASGFSKYITDYIIWQPNGSYWEPLNVKRVLTRGAELQVHGAFFISAVTLSFGTNYTYTRATNLHAVTIFDQSKGKQLIYVPLHLLKANVRLALWKFYVKPVLTYTHEVFITTDNSQSLKGYALLDLEVGKDFVIKGDYEIGLAFRVNNVANTNYQNVAQRPMPGRAFEGMLRFNISK